MIILCLILIPIIYTFIKLILYFIVRRCGKFSYDGMSVAGFTYNSEKDVFYSTKSAWQKNFGYSHLYDVGAPLFRMIIDTQPVRFFYDGRNFLITFWKGQYGIVTGAEIGIYCTSERNVNKNTVYLPVQGHEMLNMSFVLFRKGKKIMAICAKHWWLAAFKLGMFSRPKDLSMDINITFPCREMLDAFLISFKKLGYKSKDYKTINCTFMFHYKRPRTHRVWTRNFLTDSITQLLNYKNVKLYNKYLADVIDDNRVDDSKFGSNNFIMLNEFIPDFLKGVSDSDIGDSENPRKVFYKDNVILLNEKIYSELKKDYE